MARNLLTETEASALERLIAVAKTDTGQAGKIAAFLLAWWNATECGGFDLTDVWGLDTSLQNDVLCVFGALIRARRYPDTLGYEADFKAIVREWRPALGKQPANFTS